LAAPPPPPAPPPALLAPSVTDMVLKEAEGAWRALPREPMALFKCTSQLSRSAALDLHRIGYFLPLAVVSKMPYLRADVDARRMGGGVTR